MDYKFLVLLQSSYNYKITIAHKKKFEEQVYYAENVTDKSKRETELHLEHFDLWLSDFHSLRGNICKPSIGKSIPFCVFSLTLYTTLHNGLKYTFLIMYSWSKHDYIHVIP